MICSSYFWTYHRHRWLQRDLGLLRERYRSHVPSSSRLRNQLDSLGRRRWNRHRLLHACFIALADGLPSCREASTRNCVRFYAVMAESWSRARFHRHWCAIGAIAKNQIWKQIEGFFFACVAVSAAAALALIIVDKVKNGKCNVNKIKQRHAMMIKKVTLI